MRDIIAFAVQASDAKRISMFRGAALQATMVDVRMQGIHSLRVVLRGDNAEVFQREAEGRASIDSIAHLE